MGVDVVKGATTALDVGHFASYKPPLCSLTSLGDYVTQLFTKID